MRLETRPAGNASERPPVTYRRVMQCSGLVEIRAVARPRPARPMRTLVLWLMLAALPVQGVATLLVGLLGASHQHSRVTRVEQISPGLQDVRRFAYDVRAAAPAHSHSLWLRHHHSTADATVTALDDTAQDPASDGAGTSAAQLTLCTPGACATSVAAAGATGTTWPGYLGQPWDGPAAIPLDRPPKA